MTIAGVNPSQALPDALHNNVNSGVYPDSIEEQRMRLEGFVTANKMGDFTEIVGHDAAMGTFSHLNRDQNDRFAQMQYARSAVGDRMVERVFLQHMGIDEQSWGERTGKTYDNYGELREDLQASGHLPTAQEKEAFMELSGGFDRESNSSQLTMGPAPSGWEGQIPNDFQELRGRIGPSYEREADLRELKDTYAERTDLHGVQAEREQDTQQDLSSWASMTQPGAGAAGGVAGGMDAASMQQYGMPGVAAEQPATQAPQYDGYGRF